MSASGNNMNCENCKQAIATDPSTSTDAIDAHVAVCESCAARQSEMRVLDDKIARALAIRTPELSMPDLPPIEGGNVVRLPVGSRGTFSLPTWLAIAASFALAAVLVSQFVGNEATGPYSLADDILAHIDHEPGALVASNVAVTDDRLSEVVGPTVGTMSRDFGLITYAQSCVIHGRTIPHLVIQGKKGPITLLLMPEETVSGASKIEGEGVNGVILPVGNGSIAIIGERDEQLDEIEQSVLDSLDWRI
jgi:hypothetical protein